MHKETIDNKMLIKYLRFLIDFSTQLLNSPDFNTDDFESLTKESNLFVKRLENSNQIDNNLRNEIINYKLDQYFLGYTIAKLLIPDNSNFEGGIDYKGALENVKFDIKNYRDKLSNILFKIDPQA